MLLIAYDALKEEWFSTQKMNGLFLTEVKGPKKNVHHFHTRKSMQEKGIHCQNYCHSESKSTLQSLVYSRHFISYSSMFKQILIFQIWKIQSQLDINEEIHAHTSMLKASYRNGVIALTLELAALSLKSKISDFVYKHAQGLYLPIPLISFLLYVFCPLSSSASQTSLHISF